MTRPPLDLRAFGIHDASGIATRWDQQRGEWWDAPPDNARAAGSGIGPFDLEASHLLDRWKETFGSGGVHEPPFDGPFGRPNCQQIEPPPIVHVGASFNGNDPGRDKFAYPIRFCMNRDWGATDWPPTDCRAPCLQPQVCSLPTQAEIAQVIALPDMVIRKVTDDELRRRNELDDADLKPLAYTSEADWVDFVRAAVAMLRANRDLLEWSLCLAAAYNPRMTPADSRRIWAWLEERLDRGFNVYLVGCFGGNSRLGCRDPDYDGEDATTGATESWQHPVNCLHSPVSCFVPEAVLVLHEVHVACESAVPPEGDGVVLPGDVQSRVELMNDHWLSAGNTVDTFIGILNLAGDLVHELIHLAAVYPVTPMCPPGFAPDSNEDHTPGSKCWRLQAQTTHNFVYAMYSRYNCSGHRLDDAIDLFMFAG
ncbi:MAG: hypothetical protein H6735_01355 [Alphaproteobacteria bacterium]|nr:hypothetical protein [Alphaproteobacteria bacterium]